MNVRRTFALAGWVLFFNTGVFGQEEFSKSEVQKHRIKSVTLLDQTGRVKKVYNYNEEGILTHTGIKAVASIITSKELVYNDKKLLIEEKNFNPLGNLHFTHRYTYNSDNLLVKKETFDSQGQLESTWTYEYDDDDNLIYETQTSKTLGNNATRYKYHKKRLIEEETSNETLGKEEKITFLYNERGLVSEQRVKSFFTNSTTTITFYYNEDGKLVRQQELTGPDLDGETLYEYDEQGLLQKLTTKSIADNLTDVTLYKFEYY